MKARNILFIFISLWFLLYFFSNPAISCMEKDIISIQNDLIEVGDIPCSSQQILTSVENYLNILQNRQASAHNPAIAYYNSELATEIHSELKLYLEKASYSFSSRSLAFENYQKFHFHSLLGVYNKLSYANAPGLDQSLNNVAKEASYELVKLAAAKCYPEFK